jgi:hypothetical protein
VSESQKYFWGGLLLIAIGVGMALFGGQKSSGGARFELFGFQFGAQRWEPMSRLESLFWGAVAVVAGVVLMKFA